MLPLFFAAIMCAGFVASKLRDQRAKGRTIVGAAFSALLLFIVVPVVVTGDWPARYAPLVLHEGPFDWPAGCVNREYRNGDEISITCHDYRNKLSRKLVFDHGFYGLIGRHEKDYFRVGAEAINFDCNYFTERCTVRHAERDVFQ
jgi:hypothetical protein